MGTWFSTSDVQSLIDTVPVGKRLVLDEAHVVFAAEPTAPRSTPAFRVSSVYVPFRKRMA